MNPFFKFPHTPHLFWLGKNLPRDDKVLLPVEAKDFLGGTIYVEEKVDGANVGISFSDEGNLIIQNRGQYLKTDEGGQFKKIWTWARRIEEKFFDVLGDRLILFGEWCYAKHSVLYTHLPDWFLGFDVFDHEAQAFWPVEKRNRLLNRMGLFKVAEVAFGRMNRDVLIELLERPSAYGAKRMEGLYLRYESNKNMVQRAKIVRTEFTEEIDEHWSRKPQILNKCRAHFG